MRVEVIQDQHDFLGFRVVNVDQFANEVRPILTRAMLGDFDPVLATWYICSKNQEGNKHARTISPPVYNLRTSSVGQSTDIVNESASKSDAKRAVRQ